MQITSRVMALTLVSITLGSLIIVGAKGAEHAHQSIDQDRQFAARSIPEESRNRGTHEMEIGSAAGIGLVEPKGEVVELSASEAGIIRRVLVAEGDLVEQEQPLFQFDDESQRVSLKVAEESLRLAQLKLQRLKNGARPEELARARATLSVAQADHEFAEANFARFTALRSNGSVSQEAIDRARNESEVKRAQVAERTAILAETNAGPRADDIALAEQEVTLEAARVEEAKIAVDRRQVRAPRSGAILRIHKVAGELHSPDQNQSLLQMANLNDLQVRLEVDERDVTGLAVGSPAFVTDYSLGEKRIPAVVDRVLQWATPKRSQLDRPGERFDTRVVDVILRLEPGSGLVPGMRTVGFVERLPE